METEKIKFVVITYNAKKRYNNDIFEEVLDKETTATWKKAINIVEKKKKNFSKKDYPQRKIVIKEKFREGWKVVSTRI